MNEKKVLPVGTRGSRRCKKEGDSHRSRDTDDLEDAVLREISQSEKGPAHTGSLGRATSVPREPQTQRRDADRWRPLDGWLKW